MITIERGRTGGRVRLERPSLKMINDVWIILFDLNLDPDYPSQPTFMQDLVIVEFFSGIVTDELEETIINQFNETV